VFGALVGRRLEQLRRTTQRIAGGERVTTNLAGADEVATLGNAIDSMAASIWRRQDDVQRTHEALMAERQQYAEGLAEARDAAVDHSRAKTEFLQTMSHELRTPMNGIIGMTRLLRDTTLDAQQADYVEMIRASSESLFAITSDILDFSKLDAGKVQLERVEFDVQDVLDEVMSVLAGPAAARHLALAAWCRPGVPLVVSGDPSRLRQVLLNLVSNAVKFTEQGRVTVEVSDHAGSLRFSVVDTGCGISPEAQARLFTPFTQADSSTTRKYGGTGLGLAIVKRLVDLMGGQVTLSSSAAGSVFEVTVPLPAIELRKTPELTGHTVVLGVEHPVHTPALEALLMRVGARVVKVHRPEAVPTEGVALVPATWVDALPVGPAIGLLTDARLTPQPRQAAFQVTRPVRRQALVAELRRAFGLQSAGALVAELPRFEGVRVLVAEDNTINQRVICGLLERLGCHPTVVGDGRASVTAIATGRFEVVLMDCQMPELDGLAATRELRLDEANRSLPIIALTANATNEDQAACLAAGMNGFLSKPVRLETLAEELKRHLGVRSASVVG
jgi:signal transduction histidine kinase/CheY-like chemotaxis protein